MFYVYYVVLYSLFMVSHSLFSFVVAIRLSLAYIECTRVATCISVSMSEFTFECMCQYVHAICVDQFHSIFLCSFIAETGFGFNSRPQLLRCVTNESKRISMSIVLPTTVSQSSAFRVL